MKLLILLSFVPLVGAVLGIFSPKKLKNHLKLFLAFGGAYILSITMLHLIPEVFSTGYSKMGYWVLLGFFLQIVLDLFSQGIEHGHSHSDTKKHPIILFFALAIHALLEGTAIGGEFFESKVLYQLVVGIGFHEIPAAFTLIILLRAMNWKIHQLILVGVGYSLLVPIGILLGHYVLPNNPDFTRTISAMVIGVFLHISTTIIFENSEDHKLNIYKAIAICSALALAILSSLF